MKRVKQLDNIIFKWSIHILEEEEPSNMLTSSVISASGDNISYVKKIRTPTITLISKDSGWITADQRDALFALENNIGSEFVLYYTDGTTDKVVIDFDKRMKITPLYEGSELYIFEMTLRITE